jgi:hypothetical protein
MQRVGGARYSEARRLPGDIEGGHKIFSNISAPRSGSMRPCRRSTFVDCYLIQLSGDPSVMADSGTGHPPGSPHCVPFPKVQYLTFEKGYLINERFLQQHSSGPPQRRGQVQGKIRSGIVSVHRLGAHVRGRRVVCEHTRGGGKGIIQ